MTKRCTAKSKQSGVQCKRSPAIASHMRALEEKTLN